MTKPRRTVIARASNSSLGINRKNSAHILQRESKKQNPEDSRTSGFLFSPAPFNAGERAMDHISAALMNHFDH